MSRQQLPLTIRDVSAFARSLSKELSKADDQPGHLEWLNMLARASGYKNYQHLKADQKAAERLNHNAADSQPVDHKLIEQASRHVNLEGQLLRWPSKASHRTLCLWLIWSHLPPKTDMNERDVNERLRAMCLFEDHVSVRRALVDFSFVDRSSDGSRYRRRERPPAAPEAAFIRHIGSRTS
ncbi:DUF2087 domain-containing protein [uncultured Cohaesibacter sp.]|uniref:DUF2087 domain-containing protein n=1 Tax=uncultured Cohaesibacter sp. TaxID=1002546 RepID=UPI0029C8B80F|nr:DUF2087 domain-containing protein [uncultured Cohaesibacter sp.]